MKWLRDICISAHTFRGFNTYRRYLAVRARL